VIYDMVIQYIVLEYCVGLGFLQILMTLIAVWKVDSLGRRPLLIGGVGLLVGRRD
jgi:hypothetical protein